MKEWLVVITEQAIVLIDVIALITIVVGTVQAAIALPRMMLPSISSQERREIWLRYARWLVAGLTFQLAADIIETSISTSWETIGRLAAIAVIRTFLNVFLERDLAEMRERQRSRQEARGVGNGGATRSASNRGAASRASHGGGRDGGVQGRR